MRRLAAALLVAAAVGAGCSSGSASDTVERGETLRPTFRPETSTTTAVGGSSSSTTAGTTATSTAPAPTTPPATAATEPAAAASVTDARNDLTPSVESPPPWADLVGGRLERAGSTFTLRVALGGGAAPQRAPDDDHTMNVAAFFDVDGDGRIDYEVWANVSSTGWGSSYFDDVHGRASFKERSGVVVHAEADQVVFSFPASLLDGAARFRWSVSSEWGRYEAIGTIAAARDYMPPDTAVAFPGP